MNSALNQQIGGEHYKKLLYQPIMFISKMHLSFSQGCIVKYVSRYKQKNGIEDLKKAIHYCKLAQEVLDYSPLRAWWFCLWHNKTEKELLKYYKCNELSSYAEDCIRHTVYCNFEEAITDLYLLIYHEFEATHLSRKQSEK